MLDYLFKPSSVAVIGASSVPEKVGYSILSNLIVGGYEGEIIPVNPKADEILNRRCYKDISQYKGTVDMSVITVPTKFVKDSVISSIDAGAKALTIITAGFKEVDEEGANLEREIVEIFIYITKYGLDNREHKRDEINQRMRIVQCLILEALLDIRDVLISNLPDIEVHLRAIRNREQQL